MTIHQLNGVTNQTVAPVVDDDELTVVRPRAVESIAPVSPVPSGRRAPVTVPIDQRQVEPVSSFNPLKILIPAAAGLLVVFAVIYFFTRNAETDNQQNGNQPSLVADPNSKPVDPAQPATGKNEQGIPAGGTFVPAANTNANVNTNANAQPSVTPLEEETNPNINANGNTNANANVNANPNANRKAPTLPEPTRSVNPEAVPPGPSPSSSKPAVPKTSPPAAEATPSQ